MVMGKSILKIVLVIVLVIAGAGHTHAQTQATTGWDTVLDRYELICSQCMDLRSQIQQGRQVAAADVTSLFQELAQLRNSLQNASGSMTSEQKKRFAEIRDSYQGSTQQAMPTNEPETVTPPPAIPETDFEVNDSVPAPPVESIPNPTAERSLPQKGAWQAHVMGMAEFGNIPEYGLAIAVGKQKYGLVLGALSNFRSVSSQYTCLTDGTITGEGHFWGDGSVSNTRCCLMAGMYCGILDHIIIYANSGVCSTRRYWRDSEGRWARVTDISGNGALLGTGAILPIGRLSLTSGIQYDCFENSVRWNAGLGFRF